MLRACHAGGNGNLGAMPFSTLSHLECSRTGTRYDADVVQGTSDIGAPLLARYDLDAVTVTPAEIATRPAVVVALSRTACPFATPRHVVTLGEGMTPLLPLPRHGARLGVPGLLMKDEGLLPTGAFKARGAAVGVSRAVELGVRGIAMPTNGNAGAAWAAYAARAGIDALIAMPVDAPEITRRECVAAGAELILVDGLIGDAGRIVARMVTERDGYQDTSTLREPYRIEGKKTMGFEIAEQLGWRCPDVLLYPTGGGVGIIAIYKALLELRELGWMTATCRGWSLCRRKGARRSSTRSRPASTRAPRRPIRTRWPSASRCPKALGDFLVLDAVRATGGTAIAVSDDALLAAQRELAADEGTWVCPEGAACFAAVESAARGGVARRR